MFCNETSFAERRSELHSRRGKANVTGAGDGQPHAGCGAIDGRNNRLRNSAGMIDQILFAWFCRRGIFSPKRVGLARHLFLALRTQPANVRASAEQLASASEDDDTDSRVRPRPVQCIVIAGTQIVVPGPIARALSQVGRAIACRKR